MNKLNIKDIITIGIYSSIYFVLVGLGTLTSVIVIHSANMMLAPACIALIAGSAYYLLIAKTQKFGAITSLGIIMSIFFFMSGHFILSFVPSLLCGLVADGIAMLGKYKNKLTNLVSYIVFSFGNLGPIILMWFAKDQYIQKLSSKGKSVQEINAIIVEFNYASVLHLLGGILIAAIIGGLFAEHLIQKHFKKAGMVK